MFRRHHQSAVGEPDAGSNAHLQATCQLYVYKVSSFLEAWFYDFNSQLFIGV